MGPLPATASLSCPTSQFPPGVDTTGLSSNLWLFLPFLPPSYAANPRAAPIHPPYSLGTRVCFQYISNFFPRRPALGRPGFPHSMYQVQTKAVLFLKPHSQVCLPIEGFLASIRSRSSASVKPSKAPCLTLPRPRPGVRPILRPTLNRPLGF